MYDLLFDYFDTVVFVSTDTSLAPLLEALSHVMTIVIVIAIILAVFGFMKRMLFWVGSMFGGGYI